MDRRTYLSGLAVSSLSGCLRLNSTGNKEEVPKKGENTGGKSNETKKLISTNNVTEQDTTSKQNTMLTVSWTGEDIGLKDRPSHLRKSGSSLLTFGNNISIIEPKKKAVKASQALKSRVSEVVLDKDIFVATGVDSSVSHSKEPPRVEKYNRSTLTQEWVHEFSDSVKEVTAMAICDKRLFVGASNPSIKPTSYSTASFHVFDRQTGKEEFSYKLDTNLDRKIYSIHKYRNIIFIGDLNGNFIYHIEAEEILNSEDRFGFPIGTYFYQNKENLYSSGEILRVVDMKSKEESYQKQLSHYAYAPPELKNGLLLVPDGSAVYGIDPQSGQQLWVQRTGANAKIRTPPKFWNNLVFIATGGPHGSMESTLYGIEPDDGSLVDKKTFDGIGDIKSDSEHLYVASDGLHAVNLYK